MMPGGRDEVVERMDAYFRRSLGELSGRRSSRTVGLMHITRPLSRLAGTSYDT